MEALSTLMANLLRSGMFLISVPLLGGVDEEGPHIYSYDPLGGMMEEDYTVTGSGSQFALGVLEQGYTEGLTVEETRSLVNQGIRAAAERDTASGNGLTLAEVTSDGVTIDEYDSFEAAPDPN